MLLEGRCGRGLATAGELMGVVCGCCSGLRRCQHCLVTGLLLVNRNPLSPMAVAPPASTAALLTLDPATIGMLTSAAMLAPDGRCKTLDAAADG